MEGETQEQINNRPWLYKKGQSGNPGGRPKGSKSMKQWIKEKMETMTDEEREDYLEHIPKEIIWKMAEGNPRNESDVSIKELPIIQVASEILEKNALNPRPEDNSQGQPQV